ncbi:transmembrane protein 131 isoform X2 [Eucalyptus grandis]|uniref:transmembrane protein 131 isoform X2 n=1 Tax=Eucalyptus grandis TaxID=71139 RepID=UPI000525D080|nr:transmembrane protein 131 isoform X2 [Eucalyptus grandis]
MAALPTDAEPAASAAADRMVKIEMEAAEALAGLAHFTSRRSAGGSGGKWGRGARRMTKRAKSESPPAPQPQPQPQRRTPSRSALEPGPACGSAARRADPPEESLCEQQLENMSVNVVAEQVKAEEDTDLLNGGSNMCSTSYLSLGVSRSRQNLNEAEKEEKRLRRVLANRESARRTIRRRQALCEELTRRAAELTQENEKLKKGKESALREYQLLETTNKQLKAQMAKSMTLEEEVTPPAERRQAPAQMSTPQVNCPLLWYRSPFAPLFWPPVFQSTNTGQSQEGPLGTPGVSPSATVPAFCKLNTFHEQETLTNESIPRPPLYIFPCPWFFTVPDPGSVQHQEASCCPRDKEDEDSTTNQVSDNSSRTVTQTEDSNSHVPIVVKSEASSPTRCRIKNDLNEIPVESPSDGGDLHEEVTPTPALPSSIGTGSCVKHENGIRKRIINNWMHTPERS